ncbi:coatomer epsilon subunit-domain-containing protein [Tuber brumale]|nr:coatomer epsilon subunit-domain-containing protein [Tuber brumale]
MDPFSSEGELLTIHNAFHGGQYSAVINHDTSGLSAENSIPSRVYKLRSQIAIGQAEEVAVELEGKDNPDLAALKAFAEYSQASTEDAVKTVESLVESSSDNATVQIIGATVFHAEGRSEEALTLLSRHQGSLEAVALIVQIRLSQNRTDLALKEVLNAKRWAQDSLLVNLAESWVGLRIGGEKYQQAYYVYEELAQTPSTSTPRTLIGQAVAELHLGRLPEAEVALQQALEKNPKHEDALANMIVLSILAGKEFDEHLSSLQNAAPSHPFLTDVAQKSELFDKAAAKYRAKV